MEKLQDQLTALKRRLAQEKEEKDRLAIENERLLRGATMETRTLWQDRNTTKVEVVYVPREKRCKMYTGQSSNVPLNDWIEDPKSVFRSGNFTPHQAVDYKWEHSESEAKQEIKYIPKEIRFSPERIFEALLESIWKCSILYCIAEKVFFKGNKGKLKY